MGKELIKIEEIKKGLESSPHYVDYLLEWITDTGYSLFEDRLKTMGHWYKAEEDAALNAIEAINSINIKNGGNNMIVVDIGAGKSQKSVRLLSSLLRSHPDRKIVYIPIDVSDVILDWGTYIQDFEIAKNVLDVIPIVCDATEAITHLDDITEKYKGWNVVFWGTGPITTHFPHQQLTEMINKICQFIKRRGNGFLVLTFIELSKETQLQWGRCLDLYDVSKQSESVLLGLKVIGKSDLDTKNFSYTHDYADYFSTPGHLGHWSGCVYYAQAKKDCTVTFRHSLLSDTQLNLKEGDKIRLSVDTTSSQFYEAQYLASFATLNDVSVGGIWPGCKQFGLASILYKCKD